MRTLHVGLRVADLDRALEFYGALGYDVLTTVPETGFGSLTMLMLPGDPFVTIELVHDPEGEPFAPAGIHHLVVQVESMDEAVARLTEQGVEAEEPSSPDGTEGFWTAWVTDPDGYRIELVQWPEGHPDGITAYDLG